MRTLSFMQVSFLNKFLCTTLTAGPFHFTCTCLFECIQNKTQYHFRVFFKCRLAPQNRDTRAGAQNVLLLKGASLQVAFM